MTNGAKTLISGVERAAESKLGRLRSCRGCLIDREALAPRGFGVTARCFGAGERVRARQ